MKSEDISRAIIVAAECLAIIAGLIITKDIECLIIGLLMVFGTLIFI